MSNLWYVLRTNPRCETRARDALEEAGFAPYMPLVHKTVVHHRAQKVFDRAFPMMTGYLFLAMPSDARARNWWGVRRCDGVKAVLGVGGMPEPVPGKEVEALRAAEAERFAAFQAAKAEAMRKAEEAKGGRRRPHGFVRGHRVTVSAGPFAGFGGEVTDARSRKAIRVLTSFMGGLTEISVPVDALERVD